VNLFSAVKKNTQIGVDFLPGGVAVAQVSTAKKSIGKITRSEYLPAVGQATQIQAARAGIEWGIYKSIVDDNCTTTPVPLSGTALGAFTVNLSCSMSVHLEAGGPSITTYRLTSTATTGVYGTLDYVYRSLEASVSIQPP